MSSYREDPEWTAARDFWVRGDEARDQRTPAENLTADLEAIHTMYRVQLRYS